MERKHVNHDTASEERNLLHALCLAGGEGMGSAEEGGIWHVWNGRKGTHTPLQELGGERLWHGCSIIGNHSN